MLRLFQDNFIFGEATSSQFFRVTTSTQQLHFRSSYFFQYSYFFLLFQNSFFFRAKILQNSHFLRIRSSLWQSLSGTAIFSLFRIKISKKELLFQSRYFCAVSTFSKRYIMEKVNFSEKKFSVLPTFSGELPFWSGYFFIRRYFLKQLLFQKSYIFTTYFFRSVTISQLRFFSTAALLIYL